LKAGLLIQQLELNLIIMKARFVSESLEESISRSQINEGSKQLLQSFLTDPERNQDSFISAFSDQLKRDENQKLKKTLMNIKIEDKKKLAQQALDSFGSSEKGSAWIKIRDGKIKGAEALGIQEK